MVSKKLFLLLLPACFVSGLLAKDIVITSGSAVYKGQIGGGRYELSGTEYYYKPNGEFMLKLDFERDSGRAIKLEQETTLTGRILNAKQINIDTDYGTKSFNVNGCDGSNVSFDTYFGTMTLNIGIRD